MTNLLAWYGKSYHQKQQQFIYIFSTCVVMVIIAVMSWDVFLWRQIKDKNDENYAKEQKLNVVNAKIAVIKKSYANDIKIISALKQLQQHNLSVVTMLRELSVITPQGLYLSEITKDKLHVILKGSFESYKDINKFITNIRSSNWLKNPVLSEITMLTDKQNNQFILNCSL